MSPRLAIYGVTSTALAAAVITSALHTRANFFAAAVAVGRSSGALMVLANFALFNAICVGIAFKTVFFGQLRAIEYEHLFERLWMFLTESLLALTIFRDDFSAPFALMYGVLLFLKCFHWITADRVDYMDQIPPPGPPTLFHIRLSIVIALLTLVDLVLVTYSLDTILVDGVSAMVLFASEFMILLASISGTSARYFVGLLDLRRARGRADAPSWEEKSMYLFYVDLAVDFVKLVTYLSFFAVILFHYGLPLHILRDVYMTLRSFLSRCGDLVRYRRATRDMDALYPDATAEEMESGDRTCIICREEMVARVPGQAETSGDGGGPNETPKKLACGHVFHFHCLRSWLERQQSCPTCRRDVLRNPAGPPGRARNVPPPPAPGAVPQAIGNADPANNPLQAVYNQYFGLPRDQRPAPAGPTPAPTGATTANDHPVTTRPATEPEEQRIQRSIWGGPIVPGRFFPTPLGAAPRSPLSTERVASTSGTVPEVQVPPARLDIPAVNSPPTQVQSETTAFRPPLPASTSRSTLTTPVLASGTATPFSSIPPQIFTSTSASRPAEDSSARRQAADAALRRMGLLDGTAVADIVEQAEPQAAVTENGKGKEKADSFDDPPRYIPYLSTPQPILTPRSRPWTADRDVRAGLGERLRVLRDVDEVVWSLVGTLTRLGSAWEAEDAAAVVTDAGGAVLRLDVVSGEEDRGPIEGT